MERRKEKPEKGQNRQMCKEKRKKERKKATTSTLMFDY